MGQVIFNSPSFAGEISTSPKNYIQKNYNQKNYIQKNYNQISTRQLDTNTFPDIKKSINQKSGHNESVNQESVNQESVNQESVNQETVTRLNREKITEKTSRDLKHTFMIKKQPAESPNFDSESSRSYTYASTLSDASTLIFANSPIAVSQNKSLDRKYTKEKGFRNYHRIQSPASRSESDDDRPHDQNAWQVGNNPQIPAYSREDERANQMIWPKNRRLIGGLAEQNPYRLSDDELQKSIERGRIWFSNYPVDNTPLLLPYDLVSDILNKDARTRPFINFFIKLTRFRPWDSKEDFYSWLGLTKQETETFENGEHDIPVNDQFYGVSLHQRAGIKAMTFGCASCHIGSLFGKKVSGLSVRFPRSNELFLLSGNFMAHVDAKFLAPLLSANSGETEILIQDDLVTRHIGAKRPTSLGLDTSLAQVGLSLNKRLPDAWASFNNQRAKHPPRHYLMDHRADSKPAVWWNVKYKTRWLSDGSLEGGNPVHTNFLWNEIGRGADLKQLESWLRDNHDLSRDMVNAILHTKPPRYIDFFGTDSIDIKKAQKGQILFNQACSHCHGTYLKAWNLADDRHTSTQNIEKSLSFTPQSYKDTNLLTTPTEQDLKIIAHNDLSATVSLRYHEETPVVDVGTDPGRYLGMESFADSLNRLAISNYMGTEVIPKRGYVPPPLDGIWARYPYFHNNAVPSLCQLLTAGKHRSKIYLAVAPDDKDRDFDKECIGYPQNITNHPDVKERFDTSLEGQNNAGHDEGIFLKSGKEIFNWEEKKAIIEFLKTL